MYVAPPTPSPLNIHFSERVIKQRLNKESININIYLSTVSMSDPHFIVLASSSNFTSPQNTAIRSATKPRP